MSDSSTDNPSQSNQNEISDFTSTSRYETLKIPVAIIIFALVFRSIIASHFVLGYGQAASGILIWMIFVAGFNILLGYTGVVSFGHAMFLGIGMYSIAIGLAEFHLPFVVAGVLGIVFAVAAAYVVARLIVGRGEIYFAMLTISFAEALNYIVRQNPGGLTGGTNGLSHNTMPTWTESYRGTKFVNLAGLHFNWYWFVAVFFVISLLVIWQIVRSPFGRTLIAIRENKELARAMGINTDWYIVMSFTLSSVFAALAGILLEINDAGAVADTFGSTTSGNVVLMSILGGMRYYAGPITGTLIWKLASNYLSGFKTLNLPLSEFPLVSFQVGGIMVHWKILLGIIFVTIVVLSPKEGLWGYLLRFGDTVQARIQEEAYE